MNLYVLLAVVSVFLNFIHAAPGVDISNDEHVFIVYCLQKVKNSQFL